MPQSTFAIIGGDLRNLALASLLREDGKTVVLCGFDKQTGAPERPIGEIIAAADIILGATPCLSSPDTLNAPYAAERIDADAFISKLKRKQILIAGRIPATFAEAAAARGCLVRDILEREEMAILNAIPTAEGAIQLALERMKTTLHASNALVLGYGKIGRILAKMLQGIGAQVSVAARNPRDAAQLRSFGHMHIPFTALDTALPKMDVIFNTVPHILLDAHNLRYVAKHCVLIDMASRPFGIDFEASKAEGLEVVWAPSLPGRVAPVTAAQFIKETVYAILEETEALQ